MTITHEVRHGTCLLALQGDFDRANVGEVADAIDDCLGSAASIAMDFHAVTFIDGGVLSLFHDVLGNLEGRSWLAVVAPSPQVLRLLDVGGVLGHENFRIFSSMKEALRVIDQG